MRAVDIIIKKRDGQALSNEEIGYFIQAYTRGDIPDYQASALAMAILLRGMTPRETTDLTLAMAHSGDLLDLSSVVPLAVDKHSTGGVGDKTTLVVEPTVAACGLPVGKMSGRGLGFSGGTIDKLESIPGYRVNLSTQEFLRQLAQIGLVLTGQSADLAPADGKLYALRDVTGTIEAIPLIASSIMSKKLAAGAQAIVLDVKWGSGAFMHTLDEARQLAILMTEIAHLAGRKAVALLADMNQPLGYAVGNALEVKEAIATLKLSSPADEKIGREVGADFYQHCLTIAGHMLVLGGKAPEMSAAQEMAAKAIFSGRAWEKFHQLVQTQGGEVKAIEDPSRLPAARLVKTISAPRAGCIQGIHAQAVGETAVLLGAGRARKGDAINHAVGIVIHCKVGDWIEKGQPLFTIHADDPSRLAQAEAQLSAAHTWSDAPVERLPLFYGVISPGE